MRARRCRDAIFGRRVADRTSIATRDPAAYALTLIMFMGHNLPMATIRPNDAYLFTLPF